jgi:hypothetical protein
MKLSTEHGRFYIEGDNWFFEFMEEYSQFFQPCNWYTFRFAMLEIENDEILGGIEATVIIAGVGFRFRWNHTETEALADIKNKVATLDKEQ